MISTSLSPTRMGMKEASPRSRSKRALSEALFHHSITQGQEHMKKVRHGNCDQNAPNESALHIVAPFAPPKLVSPVTSPLHSPSTSPGGPIQVTLDLTVPVPQMPHMRTSSIGLDMIDGSNADVQQTHPHNILMEDPDILAGCKALLCFSHGLNRLTA
eukprot:CAMPEP_0172374462 /NCGR_PEP_ID=MMETSP1060-20121228/55928_1 /TAXON_ID=37318 /ORGANISM="Pseudo-nitzschia pungens, Strain cf. cingulata" /LENGTH=157 /DNA_ID=CAMNT_0013101153 /DNA_START=444 /DNA_END=917 /DNA_ORIENTATION=+